MGHKFPFKRNCRCNMDGCFSGEGYITHPEFADSPIDYIRAFMLIQKDLINLFDYIEPSDTNEVTYSFRIHELLIRTCIEIEANFRAILIENGYQKKSADLNMGDYKKLNTSHRLSSYSVLIPYWSGNKSDQFSHSSLLLCNQVMKISLLKSTCQVETCNLRVSTSVKTPEPE